MTISSQCGIHNYLGTLRPATAGYLVRSLAVLGQWLGANEVGRANAADNKETEPQLRRAAAAIEQLSFPWDKLFEALESSMNEDIALLSVRSDMASGIITLNAEARDWDAMLDYIRRLNEDKFLTGMHLVRHQIRQSDPQHPVRFALSCT